MKITDNKWEVLCENAAQKRTLLSYAESKGLKVEREAFGNDNELAFGRGTNVIYSFPASSFGKMDDTPMTADAFRKACDEYALGHE